MADIAWHIMHWPTVAGFREYVTAIAAPSWASGLTVHHTLKPTIAEWNGQASMIGMRNYYRDVQKWPAGPHLFIAPDGIWQGTPITQRGVHAGDCNASRIGIEVVGNYNLGPWLEPIRSLAYGALTVLCQWLKRDEACIVGHRDCMPGRDCPGTKISMPDVRAQVGMLLRPVLPAGTYPVDPIVAKVYEQSGGVWRPNALAPGYAITPLFQYTDGKRYQLFERAGVRVLSTTSFEWLRTDEVEVLKRWRG